MILTLRGHDYKYAVEQIVLMLYPEERPEYSDAPDASGALSAVVTLSRGEKYFTAHTRLFDGGVFDGYARAAASKLTDRLSEDRLLQRAVKLSFFRAAKKTGKDPVWGSLTGIRPAKLMTELLRAGLRPETALRRFSRDHGVTGARAELCLDSARAGLAVQSALSSRDICLYIGIPFCPTRCAYCSFVSHSVEKSMKLIEPFLSALEREIDAAAETVRALGLSVISVYMGGGTPTTLSPEQLDRLLGRVEEKFDLSRVREYTVEAGRPDTITAEKLAVLRRRGVGRVSVNPQTMSDAVLEAIGRRHTAKDVLDAVELVRRSGIPCVNMDLIAGLPTDTPAGFEHTLDEVLKLSPENVTVHTLSLKKGTRITLEGTRIPSGDEVSAMLDSAMDRLRVRGYSPYYLYRQKFMSGGFENVGWTLPGRDSLYNICIMEEYCTIVALGGGGSTKLVSPASGRIERVFNAKYPYEYIENIDRICENKAKIAEFYRENGMI